MELDPSNRLPVFADLSDRAVSLGVMSKTYGLAGLRIGWIATRNDLLFRELAAFKDYTTICNAAPSEFLAALALRHAEVIVERNLQIIGRNLELLDRFFGSYGELFHWGSPEGRFDSLSRTASRGRR
ncbi:MAG: aminotransferase class I/II-fold pyridoxal phosphate-dependent enzyme [Desulfobacterales bacterium]|nr:aminotransferase class I/II-fold pyridoxal phosphate-dependent enzyme [Desulfobacterales bacterium]